MASKNNGLLECPKKDGMKVQGNAINALLVNETVRDLIKFFDNPEPAAVQCHRCATNEADYWCDGDCRHCFCSDCWNTIHEVGQYRTHTRRSVGDRPREVPQCQGHGDHSIQFWCEQCAREICGECQQTQHAGHTSTEIGTYVRQLKEQCEVRLEGVQASLNYRSDRADKLITEVEKESEFNQTRVRETMQNLRNLIDRREETLLGEIRQVETADKSAIEEHKLLLQDEQQNLIEQVLNFAVVSKDEQPQRLLNARRPFDDFIRRADARLSDLKPRSRIKNHVTGLEDLATLQTKIENVKFEPLRHTNPNVEQIFDNNPNSTTLNLSSSRLKDLDIELVANRLACHRTLTTLKLYSSEISEMGAQYLADALRTNQTLTNLELHNNKVGTEGLEHFADALRTNKTLTILTLYHNGIKNEVAQCIADGLKTNKRMETQIRNVNDIPVPTCANEVLLRKITDNGNNTTLNLSSSNLTDQDMEFVAYTLKTNTVVTTLYLNDNQIGVVGTEYLADGLQMNRTLTRLDIYTNQIGPIGAGHLAEALKVNTTLNILDLRNNQIGENGAQHLANALTVNRSLTYIDLRWNQIGDNGAEKLAEMLRTNQTLQQLWLSNNQIGDGGAQHIANALTTNQTLKEVYLGANAITDVGAQHFANMLENNRILTGLDLNGNQITNTGAQQLANALNNNRKFNHENCYFENRNDTRNTTLTHLYLHENQIKDEGARHLAAMLTQNQGLKELSLSYNQIGNDGAQQLGNALGQNRTIQVIYLVNNNGISNATRTNIQQQQPRIKFSI
ncbi:unnamed protein product [Adineta ricciae]|uniref:B box-type domain-containing protein n=1 Tax=Adineta ricciae TaxID=249248 RepID=A0A815FGM4_ADIRI|nr:unnamed protein product [Adineta ricciae]